LGVVVFLINGLVFILIGLQLRDVVEGLNEHSRGALLGYAAAVILTVVVVRVVWVYPATYLPRFFSERLRARDPYPPWQYPAIVAWAGLRGVVSLAAALALPIETDAGLPFPGRNLIIVVTFSVILATLVGQGLTLPSLLRRLGITADDEAEREETLARREAARAALMRIDGLTGEPWVPRELAGKLRYRYEHILEHLPDSLDPADVDGDHIAAHDRLRREVLRAQRVAVIELRNRGEIFDEALHRVERDLDLEEVRSEV
jgi:CPA1 family monovalent cation:H+ antiporter